MEQTADVDGGEAVDPIVGAHAADILRHLREIFRGDAELVGIVAQLTVLDVVALLQQLDEAGHDVGVASRDGAVVVGTGVEIEEVEKHHLQGAVKHVFAEAVPGVAVTLFHLFEVASEPVLLLLIELHDGIAEKRQRAAYAVVVAGRGHLNHLWRDVDAGGAQVIRRPLILDEALKAHYHAVACLKRKGHAVEREFHLPLLAENVDNIIDEFFVYAKPVKVVLNNNTAFVECHNCFRIISLIYKVNKKLGTDGLGSQHFYNKLCW